MTRNAFAVLICLTLTLFSGCYSMSAYQGDGKISEPKKILFGSYLIVFDDVHVGDDSREVVREYEFSGTPNGSMDFQLRIPLLVENAASGQHRLTIDLKLTEDSLRIYDITQTLHISVDEHGVVSVGEPMRRFNLIGAEAYGMDFHLLSGPSHEMKTSSKYALRLRAVVPDGSTAPVTAITPSLSGPYTSLF